MMRKNITKKYKVYLVVILLLLIVVSCVGVSYAFSPKPSKEEEDSSLVVTVGNLSITYFENEEISCPNFAPNDTYELNFSVTNSSSSDVYYSLGFDDVINVINGEVGLDITSTNGGGTITNGNFPKDASEIINQVKIGAETTQHYTLKVVNKTDTIGEIGGKIKVEILNNVIAEDQEMVKSFASIILENNPVAEPLTTPGKENAEISEGLIKNEDDLGTSYYFRGSVTNNYVNFANLTWRIVRINGDNSVRLILDGILNETTIYNQVAESNYLDSYKFSDSAINLFLNSWYESNLKEVEDKIIASNFCTDYTPLETIGYQETYAGFKNLSNGTPSLKCNSRMSLKIGLITIDEVLLAGNFNSNTKTYLSNNQILNGWWTMSPSYKNNNTNELYVYSINAYTDEIKDSTLITSEKGIRPVINLNKNVTVTGDGTKNNPYTIA